MTEQFEELEANEADGTSAPELPSTDPKDIIATTERDFDANDLSRYTGSGGVVAEPSLEDLVKQLLMNRYPEPADLIAEFETFRKQVIAAFAHLGLDVRKHFGV